MLLNLVKKDFLLVKKYLIIMFVAAIVLPVFIRMKTNFLIDVNCDRICGKFEKEDL